MAGALTLTAPLAEFETLFPGCDTLCVAYSGGRDSHTLLATAAAHFADTPVRVSAVTVDHGLHPDSRDWAQHCEAVCAALGVPLQVLSVEVPADHADGPEAAARQARYAAFASVSSPHTVIAQAHHADDQAETVLLRLLRGTGVHGAAGMPAHRALETGWLWRPYLHIGADDIAREAQARGLVWVEDPSNRDTRFDRNFLRLRVLPVLRERWPRAVTSLTDAAAHFADASGVLDKQLDTQLDAMVSDQTLDCRALRALSQAEAVLLLHRWYRRKMARMPARRLLERALDEVVNARSDAQPCLQLGDCDLRRHRDRLYLTAPLVRVDSVLDIPWPNPSEPLDMPDGSSLTLEAVLAAGLDRRFLDGTWVVRFRRGGEMIKLPGRPRASLKKILHAAAIPPWERPSVPLLYINETLAWGRGIGVDVQFHIRD